MKNTISIRTEGSYGKHSANAFDHLKKIGIENVEIPAPKPDQVEATQEHLQKYGLKAATLTGRTDLSKENVAETLRPVFESAKAMGVPIVFTSAKAGDLPKAEAYKRLREIGDLAQQYGVTVALETHPDLCENGTVALETMQGVNHRNIRINFDPANIRYYNEGIDVVDELRKIAPYVASVHLKDTNGGYKTWNFPALGEGIVDFPAIFKIMNERGMYGPFTMELEGIEGENLTEAQAQDRVKKSLDYLKQNGVA